MGLDNLFFPTTYCFHFYKLIFSIFSQFLCSFPAHPVWRTTFMSLPNFFWIFSYFVYALQLCVYVFSVIFFLCIRFAPFSLLVSVFFLCTDFTPFSLIFLPLVQKLYTLVFSFFICTFSFLFLFTFFSLPLFVFYKFA